MLALCYPAVDMLYAAIAVFVSPLVVIAFLYFLRLYIERKRQQDS